MDTRFQKSKNTTDEWYTPREIIDTLGPFDLDPCAPIARLWDTAAKHFNKQESGLLQEWFGRVWLNPPYSHPLVFQFVKRLAEHGNGIALLFDRCDTKMFHEVIFPSADGVYFLRERVRFYRPDGTRGGSPGCGSVLVAFGENNTEKILNSGLKGTLLRVQR